MAISPQNRQLIEQQMKNLDYIQGQGLFPREKRSVNKNHRYLIISYGGTGADALYPLKKLLQDELPEDEFKSHVRLLAVDTDMNTRYEKIQVIGPDGQPHTKDVERFTPAEFLWLDNKPARNMVDKNLIGGMTSWVNPRLIKTIQANPTYLDGSGAGSVRQVGRILLSTDQTFQNFILKVKTIISDLTAGNADPLKVFIISGIAGGTGSGIVVDASYMVRHAIAEIDAMGSGLASKTSVSGFIMLPPTGTSNDPVRIASGNRNGVAALKEIDHFMTIGKRHERYEQYFGITKVISDKPIFDVCYLLDGAQDGVVHANPREKAVEVIKNCILDMITSQPVDSSAAGGGTGIQDVASFMSDAPAFAENLVKNNSIAVAPREANYIYCAIGHGKTLIPLELMKAYVAKNVFDKMYRLFRNCENVTEDDVDAFLNNVGAPKDGALSGASNLSKEEIRKNVNQQVAFHFGIDPNNPGKKGGPYYVINLLNGVMAELAERHNHVNSYAMATAKPVRLQQYEFIRALVSRHSHELFEVYVTVLEELRKHLESSSDILCDSTLFRNYYRSSYTFTPIDFGSSDSATKIVRQYLDGLISSARTGELCSDLVKEMLGNREAWTQLVVAADQDMQPKFAAAQRIREFWQVNINKIVNASLEDYLIKYYSQNPNAEWKEINGEPTPQADAAMKIAAAALVKQMWGAAGAAVPLAAMQTNLLNTQGFNGHKSFLIPKGAPHLIKYVKQELANSVDLSMKAVKVAPSTANDRISCYAQFTNIPAYMFKWASMAEPNYESAIQAATDGLHMSETSGGTMWRNFPNLIPESLWSYIGLGYEQVRESDLNKIAHDNFASAKALGLTTMKALATTAEYGYYTIRFLPDKCMLGADFLKAVDSEMVGTPAWKIANDRLQEEINRLAGLIFAKQDWTTVEKVDKEGMAVAVDRLVSLDEFSLQFTDTVMTPGANDQIENWEDYLAGALLRTSAEYTYRIRSTVMVMEKLYTMIAEAQAVKSRMDRFVHYLVAGLFDYVADDLTFYYIDATGRQRDLITFDYGDTIQEKAPYFFLFRAFGANAEELMEALEDQYAALTPDSSDAPPQRMKKARAMDEKKQPILAQINEMLVYNKANPTAGLMSKAFDTDAKGFGHDPEEIRSFYAELQNSLKFFKM